jgi:dethiobiotin synthetase
MRGLFISGTATGVGKTYVTRALAAALRAGGKRVAAVKPVETGYTSLETSDAFAIARASGRPELATAAGFYRAKPPLSPYGAMLEGEPRPPSVPALVDAIHHASRGTELCLVEGAGGLLVPLDMRDTMADLVAALGLPLVLVATNVLGVLSTMLSAAESARHRGIELRGVVLVDSADPDLSAKNNARILDERLGAPVFEFPRTENSDDALAVAASASGLTAALLDAR